MPARFKRMQATQEQITTLAFYRDIIIQNVPKIADEIGVSPQTLQGWTEGKGEPTGEEAQKILDFLEEKFVPTPIAQQHTATDPDD
jgi:transcriptional regulator with XRE-family HTH domain